MEDVQPQDQDSPDSSTADDSPSHLLRHLDCDEITRKEVPAEVALTVMANQGLCCRYIIELLDWQDNPDHYIMVLARPPPCMDMHDFWEHHGVLFSKVLVHHFMQ
ncbi:serine threonine- kinase pim-1-like protein [Labeo rohita]|uniref:non-specific serine/threonine protein kinase n=1 Tax=Labeo rohita TaxID=84645 RepID=A0A498M356_LABRO|nr:serine threonine- kinase pim-1-like protein [Labeo rohita]